MTTSLKPDFSVSNDITNGMAHIGWWSRWGSRCRQTRLASGEHTTPLTLNHYGHTFEPWSNKGSQKKKQRVPRTQANDTCSMMDSPVQEL